MIFGSIGKQASIQLILLIQRSWKQSSQWSPYPFIRPYIHPFIHPSIHPMHLSIYLTALNKWSWEKSRLAIAVQRSFIPPVVAFLQHVHYIAHTKFDLVLAVGRISCYAPESEINQSHLLIPCPLHFTLKSISWLITRW